MVGSSSVRRRARGTLDAATSGSGAPLTSSPVDTEVAGDADYTRHLVDLQTVWWKRLLPVQAPYRWNLRRLHLGRTLDLGCGIGRNLDHLGEGAVGIDHDEASVRYARSRGFEAYTPEEFRASPHGAEATFDSLLLSHVAEHLTPDELDAFVGPYLAHVRPGGTVVVICPQERGFSHDPTHVEFLDVAEMRDLADRLGLLVDRVYSFPFHRRAGKAFVYNETVLVARVPGARVPAG